MFEADPIKLELLKTGLFFLRRENQKDGWWDLRLLETNYVISADFGGRISDIGWWSLAVVDGMGYGYPIPFQEVFNNLPIGVFKKVVYHLDLFMALERLR